MVVSDHLSENTTIQSTVIMKSSFQAQILLSFRMFLSLDTERSTIWIHLTSFLFNWDRTFQAALMLGVNPDSTI